MKKEIKIGLILTVAASIVFGVLGVNEYKEVKKKEFMANMPVSVNPVSIIEIKKQDWQPYIKTVGLIDNNTIILNIQSNGIVSKIYKTSNEEVKKGEVILSLNNDVEINNLNVAKVQLDYYLKILERNKTLLKNNAISKNEFDKSKFDYDQAFANVESLKSSLERRKIIAPSDGKLGIFKIKEGEYLSNGQEIVSFKENAKPKVKFNLSKDNLVKIKINQEIIIKDPNQEKEYLGKIIFIDNEFDNSGLINVEAEFIQNEKVINGDFVNILIKLPLLKSQFILPQSSISYALSGENIYLAKKMTEEEIQKTKLKEKEDVYKVSKLNIKTIDRENQYHLVEGQLNEGDKLIVTGIQRLNDKSLVKNQKQSIVEQQELNKTRL